MTVRTSSISLLTLLAVLLLLAYGVETIIPEVTVTSLPSRPLHAFFGNRVVAQITDLHLVDLGWREWLTLSKLERIRPDLILMTGDYLESYTDFAELKQFLVRLAKIAPVIATPGNNDYCCLDTLAALMRESGITFLRNQAILMKYPGDSLYLVGLEDNFLHHDDYFKAASAVPAGADRIVLGHAPAVAETFDPSGVDLVLAGHLHGGQIILPVYGAVSRRNDCSYATRMYTAGLYHINGIPVYSNRGIGTTLIPLRFMARPEIALFQFVD
jgi:predicted MPP superfamily phosphohydrolase